LGCSREWDGTYEITVEGVTSWVTVCKNEWLVALALSPAGCELGGVPVDLVEELGEMSEASWAVTLGWPCDRSFVVKRIKELITLGVIGCHCGRIGLIVPARWEGNISAKGRSIAIAVLVWETNTGSRVGWVLNTNTMETIRVRGIKRAVCV
jgi:hypothetical protein